MLCARYALMISGLSRKRDASKNSVARPDKHTHFTHPIAYGCTIAEIVFLGSVQPHQYRLGNFQFGRMKWQVYPFGIRSR